MYVISTLIKYEPYNESMFYQLLKFGKRKRKSKKRNYAKKTTISVVIMC